jgi:hypothetical protein
MAIEYHHRPGTPAAYSSPWRRPVAPASKGVARPAANHCTVRLITERSFVSEQRYDRRPSGWAVGGVVFAASILILIGSFQIVTGLAAVINDDFFVVAPNYTFDIDTSVWGWVHLLIGVVLVFTGWGLFSGRTWARVLGIVLASISAIANFFFIPYYPLWSIVVIALDVWVIWALTQSDVADV